MVESFQVLDLVIFVRREFFIQNLLEVIKTKFCIITLSLSLGCLFSSKGQHFDYKNVIKSLIQHDFENAYNLIVHVENDETKKILNSLTLVMYNKGQSPEKDRPVIEQFNNISYKDEVNKELKQILLGY